MKKSICPCKTKQIPLSGKIDKLKNTEQASGKELVKLFMEGGLWEIGKCCEKTLDSSGYYYIYLHICHADFLVFFKT